MATASTVDSACALHAHQAAFWLLVALVDRILLPNTYNEQLEGCLVEMHTLSVLLAKKRPSLSRCLLPLVLPGRASRHSHVVSIFVSGQALEGARGHDADVLCGLVRTRGGRFNLIDPSSPLFTTVEQVHLPLLHCAPLRDCSACAGCPLQRGLKDPLQGGWLGC